MKKTSNKGFSLVELIVVIAIMGVLMVVLAPQYLKYVEKSRLQKDNSAIAEIAENMKIACADETIAKSVTTNPTTNGTITLNSASTGSPKSVTFVDTVPLQKELKSVLGETVELSSSTYNNSSTAVTLMVVDESGTLKVYATGFIDTPGATSGTSRAF